MSLTRRTRITVVGALALAGASAGLGAAAGVSWYAGAVAQDAQRGTSSEECRAAPSGPAEAQESHCAPAQTALAQCTEALEILQIAVDAARAQGLTLPAETPGESEPAPPMLESDVQRSATAQAPEMERPRRTSQRPAGLPHDLGAGLRAAFEED